MIKDIKQKIKKFSDMIEKYPDIKQFYIHRARLYEQIKDYKKATEDYKKIFPSYYVCQNIATICEEAGLIKEAENFYTKAIEEDKNNILNYMYRLYFYIRTGETEKAVNDCIACLKLSPKDETILILKKILLKK